MDWFYLLKQPKLRAGSKVTTNLGIDGEKDDGPCKRKIQEYMDKANRMDQDGYYVASPGGPMKTFTIAPDWPEEIYCSALKKLNELSYYKQQTQPVGDGFEYFQDVHEDLGDYVVNGYYGGSYSEYIESFVYMTLHIQKIIPDESIRIRKRIKGD